MRSRLPRDLLDGIDRFIAEFPEAKTRPEAVRRLVREKLESLGYLKPEDEN